MKIKKKVDNKERKVLIAMIVDKYVLSNIATYYSRDLFQSTAANLICQWCVRYYNKYNEAPGSKIEEIFERWSLKKKDKDLIKHLASFLSELSDEYEELQENINADYALDIARHYFNSVKLSRMIDDIEDDISDGEVDTAIQKIEAYRTIDIGMGRGIDLFQNPDVIREAFEYQSEILVQYPGALGKFFGHALERDGFISFLGPEKRGKTWWLIDLAYRAMLQKRRVAFFEVGDLSERQLVKRFCIRSAKKPIKPKTYEYPIRIKQPESRKGIAKVKHEERISKKYLSWRKAWKAMQTIQKRKMGTEHSYLKVSTHPNSSINVNQIKSMSQGWINNGWHPDIIIIDYADILDMNYYGFDGRDRIDETWKQMRRMSQELHCLVVTATQSDAASYTSKTIGMKHFSNDKRKLAHVTGMVGINRTKQEKRLGLYRLNWVVLREEDFDPMACVHVAGCLTVGNPAVKSCLFERETK